MSFDSHETLENSDRCTDHLDSEQCTPNPQDDEPPMIDVPSYDWLSIVDMLGLPKHATEFEIGDVMGKELPISKMWECFFNSYSSGVWFGIRIHTTISN